MPKGVYERVKKTHCLNGHRRTKENVTSSGECKKCKALRNLSEAYKKVEDDHRSTPEHKAKAATYNAKPVVKAKRDVYRKRPENKLRKKQRRLEIKEEVLTHYGKGGKLCCCWYGCKVKDLDLLTLDHKNNDGAIARAEKKDGTGFKLYSSVKRNGFPDTFQTLCWNHQWKKQMNKVRGRA